MATGVYGAMLAWGLRNQPKEETVAVELEPEIKDFAVEEEVEVEEEPPPPPKDAPTERAQKPRPRPELRPPDEQVTEAPEETSEAKVYEVGPGRGQGTGQGRGSRVEKPAAPKAKEKPPAPKRAEPKIDPKKVVDRPEKATAPIADPGNAQPEYPKVLRDKGITGVVVIKLHVKHDGTLKGAKILRVTNNAATQEQQEEADALFKKAVITVVRNWKYTPAKLEGQPISVWRTVTIPFRLSTG